MNTIFHFFFSFPFTARLSKFTFDHMVGPPLTNPQQTAHKPSLHRHLGPHFSPNRALHVRKPIKRAYRKSYPLQVRQLKIFMAVSPLHTSNFNDFSLCLHYPFARVVNNFKFVKYCATCYRRDLWSWRYKNGQSTNGFPKAHKPESDNKVRAESGHGKK